MSNGQSGSSSQQGGRQSAEDLAVLALSGGVGGAKLALGLDSILPPGSLDVLVNTADDFTHLGLKICPDIDTLLYTLSGLADQSRGWGLADESWQAMSALEVIGGETWFRLGDKDLATHLWRTQQLASGHSLSEVTAALAKAFGIQSRVLPMCEETVQTTVQTSDGELPFQQYFVGEQCKPSVSGFAFSGIEQARANVEAVSNLKAGGYGAVIICPSNPFVSVDPILGLAGLWETLRDSSAPVVVVSPIVAGMALKGPAAKMMAELDVPVTAAGVAQHYTSHYPGLIDHFVIDGSDATLADEIRQLGVGVTIAPTIMKTLLDRQELAKRVLERALG
ncbi:MAG: 2-phospho-L-lactate transferase [Halioglobus sp.]